jgi:hypothetical protein
MYRRRNSLSSVCMLVAMAVLSLCGLFVAVGCDGGDGTSFRDAFNAFGDAFSNWINQVF